MGLDGKLFGGSALSAPLQHFEQLGRTLGIDLFVQRDDLLPFPLAGNKVRKIRAELAALRELPDLLVTNGGIESNHCRTVALFAARLGIDCHLVLHGTPDAAALSPALALLHTCGARTTVVPPSEIRTTVQQIRDETTDQGRSLHVIPGGAHSRAGATAYSTTGIQVFQDLRPDVVIVASGTGATHGGLAAAASLGGVAPRVVGISVARPWDRGVHAVEEAAAWAGATDAAVEFDDSFRAGGYGPGDDLTLEAVALGWRYGLPLDSTYTGKAFSGLLAYARQGYLKSSRVLFWHTGGLWNQITSLSNRSGQAHSAGER